MNAPCYGCQARKPGCHTGCPAYISYRAEMDKFAKYMADNKPVDAMRVTHKMDKKNRRRKYKGGKQ